ncbi:circularly permuted type 2 ATP-grasp protein [Thalassoroseus pseudoceratinae]|uniref:circularly permuted type 2 ATP-grasp protein n=1 Tax=Thalassoroseus pseudoceratinae TaxID=2713176 RepID=UPI00197FF369|nr:circularly permuted type 2 ATP-grasp protein [Thalassoroseus pseudoceratinae]
MFDAYCCDGFFDEVFSTGGPPRLPDLVEHLRGFSGEELRTRQRRAEALLLNLGITFAVYGDDRGTEKVWPVDLIPRIMDATEWGGIEKGLEQRIHALNLFIDDIYNDKKIIKDGVLPEEIVATATTYRKECEGFHPPNGVWVHVTGTDLVRDRDGQIYVLEDNLRCPSGVSYVLENRELMKRTLPEVFRGASVAPVEDYPERLLSTLLDTAPAGLDEPTAVVLTPGIYNSAYFEHSFLAQQMGVELVEGQDLVVDDGFVFMQTTHGMKRVDVIYRRIDDDFLDPKCFRSNSALGVPGLMEVYKAGRVTLANAPGTGIADDKAIYAYVPQIIKYYLGEDAILNNVPTYLCSDAQQRQHVLDHMNELVVKPTNESGGYGIMLGPQATESEQATCADAIRQNPRNFIAQPMLTLSTVPTLIGDQLEPRHVDLRPFILTGNETYVLPGGLTRVALRQGSMIVNSSQGGGSKDTWVIGSASGKSAWREAESSSGFENSMQSQSTGGMSQSQSQS